MKLIWLTDTHFAQEGLVTGHDPRTRIEAAIDYVADRHHDAAGCVISGDMVDRASIEDYAGLKERTDRLGMPVWPMAGNHDDRAALRAVFPLPPGAQDGFVQYAVESDAAALLCLDTIKEGDSSGLYCASRFDWLGDTLTALGDKPAYLFLHHPPMRLHLPPQDALGMENGAAFLEFAARFPTIRHLFIGHVHRPTSGRAGGIPFSTMRSALYQAPPPRPAWDWKTFAPSPEPPMLGIIHIDGADVVLHYEQFSDHALGYGRGRPVTPPIELVDPDDAAYAALSNRFTAHNASLSSWNWRSFCQVIRAGDRIVAGGRGIVNMGALEVRGLWVDADRRGQGLGAAVLTAIEIEARRRGATRAMLYTYSFQSEGFYDRMGYAVFARFPYPDGPERIDMMKEF